jgi:ketosteroid isomerase-like protein
MKKFLLCFCLGAFLLSCNSDKDKEKTESAATMDAGTKSTVDLPYKASYSSSFSTDISDADLKLVLMSYKDWADGNMSNVTKEYGDSLEWDRPTGEHYKLPNADIMKMWTTYRDSLSSVVIDMQGWQKMYATDRKEGYVVTWYKETDTYKTGKVDAGYYHDINQVKDGKIVHLEQYKRAAK